MSPDNAQDSSDIASLPAVQSTLPAMQTQSVAPNPTEDVQGAANLKGWVQLLRATVSKTANDPAAQSQEIAKLRSGYLNKKYGRPIVTGSNK